MSWNPWPDGISYDPRCEVVCPKCKRKGRVRSRLDTRVIIEHTCPGPWTLQAVEEAPGVSLGAWRAIFWSLTKADIDKTGWVVDKL